MGAYIWSFFLGTFCSFAAVFESIWLAISGLLLVGVGWLATNFVGKPYLDFLNLKKQVHEALVFTANVGPVVRGTPQYTNAVDSLRRLGTQVQAHPLGCCLKVFGYDLAKAGHGLIALSNSLSAFDDGRTRHKKSVLDGLRLPLDLL